MWTDDWVGIPHVKRGRSKDGADCFGLVILLSREILGVEIPDQGHSRQSAIENDAKGSLRSLYARPDCPQIGDLLLFNIGPHPIHCGFYVDEKRMLHSAANIGSVLERWDCGAWAARLEGIYRYVG
jgi:cell wall-associated NlpC family hydrolase